MTKKAQAHAYLLTLGKNKDVFVAGQQAIWNIYLFKKIVNSASNLISKLLDNLVLPQIISPTVPVKSTSLLYFDI